MLEHTREVALECLSENDKVKLTSELEKPQPCNEEADADVLPVKKLRLSKKQKLHGQNKSRGPTFKRNQETELCNSLITLAEDEPLPQCERKNCVFLHDIDEYLQKKPKDLGLFFFLPAAPLLLMNLIV